jgi:poly(3-hydroxybutyrate) depolymerase
MMMMMMMMMLNCIYILSSSQAAAASLQQVGAFRYFGQNMQKFEAKSKKRNFFYHKSWKRDSDCEPVVVMGSGGSGGKPDRSNQSMDVRPHGEGRVVALLSSYFT